MDEFDVFMDSVNRRVATQTLLEFAIYNSTLQCIFLTPQDLQVRLRVQCVRSGATVDAS